LSATVEPAKEGDVLELDEAWSYVGQKANKRWLWTAMCRRTRQIVAFVIGDRSAETCATQKFLLLWAKIPGDYRACQSFSDFWKAYGQVFSSKSHQQVEKGSGETSHVERFYCTLRQRLARYVRKTLSFSKSDRMHHLVTKWFIANYNQKLSLNF
jgi:IS1 family transposase